MPTDVTDTDVVAAAGPTTSPTACPSCERPGRTTYCAHCGERLHEHTDFSFKSIIRQFFSDWLQLDTRFAQTYKTLLLKPGQLTNHHLAGRRIHFIKPLAMYTGVSALYFLAISLLQPFTIGTLLFGDQTVVATSDSVAVDRPDIDFYSAEFQQHAFAVYQEMLDKASTNTGIAQAELVARFDQRYNNILPIFMAVSVVLFALGLKVIHWQRYYYEHLIFAMHFFTFAFLISMITVSFMQYSFLWTSLVAIVIYATYLSFALKQVYNQPAGLTALKVVLALGCYYGIIVLGSMVVIITLLIMMMIGSL